MTGTRNPSRKYFTRNQPYFYKSVDNWEEWDTDEKYDRTFFIGVDDSNPEDIDVALYMIWGGKPVAVVGDKVLDTISGTVELAEQLETEIQSILEEVQELAAAVAQSEIDIEEAVATMNELVDRCEGILEGAEAARDLAKDWATKMDGMVEEEGEPVDYSAKYYANEAKDSETAAAGSASAASDDADLAEAWATKTDGTVDGSEYSSKYYAGRSADSATTAAGKAGEASASATLASKWATQLTTPVEGGEYSAKQYAQDAGISATNAGTSETNAGISAGAASGSATAAANSATLAQDWATKMDGQVASTDYSSKYYAGQSATSASNSHVWAEGTDEQVQALGGVHSSKVWAEQSTNANIALTNSPYTTNRILEIPQNIKLELNNGTLTLKAGSKLYDGLGGEHIVPSDMSFSTATGSATNQIMLIKTDFSTALFSANNDTNLSYNSTTGLVEYTGLGSYYLPVGVIIHSGSTYTGIYQVFNGFGYIGSTVFTLPGLKYEYANGLNDDRTYVNGFGETTSVLTTTYVYTTSTTQSLFIGNDADIWRCGQFFVVENPPVSGPAYCIWYVQSLNCFYSTEDGTTIPKSHKGTPLIQIASNIETNSSFRITNIDFEGVDGLLTSNVNNLSPIGRSYLSGLGAQSSRFETWTLGASDSTYTAPANGYIYIDGYPNTSIFIIGRYSGVGNADYGPAITCRVRKGETVQIRYTGNMNALRFYYAEGEV